MAESSDVIAAGEETVPPAEVLVEEVLDGDVLVEEVSIDGMCGVY